MHAISKSSCTLILLCTLNWYGDIICATLSLNLQVLINWLLEIANCLKLVEVNTSSDNGRKMCSVLVIINVLFIIRDCSNLALSSSQISFLFSMLRLRPHLDHSQTLKFLDMDFLRSFIPDQHHIEVAETLIHFTNLALPSGSASPEWIFVLPLIHFFQKKIHVHPFDSPALTSDTINWTDSSIKLYTSSKNTRAKISR